MNQPDIKIKSEIFGLIVLVCAITYLIFRN
jgi:hypothetical protein